ELDGREQERDGVAGARDGAQLAPVLAVALRVDLAAPARQVEQNELELDAALVDLGEVDVLLDRAAEAAHREEGAPEDRIVDERGREDPRQRAELAPCLLQLRDAARGVAAGVDDPDRAADDHVRLDALLVEVLQGADVVGAERRAAAEDEDAFLPAGHG